MFTAQNVKVSSSARCQNSNAAVLSEIKTSTAVVGRLATSLLGASPGQLCLARYMKDGFSAGRKPSNVQIALLSLRRIATQMRQLELCAAEAGKPIRQQDCEAAARNAIKYVDKLMQTIGIEEKSHSSFRVELIEHLENIVNWYPQSRLSWGVAYRYLLSGEFLTIKGRRCDAAWCWSVINRLSEKQRFAYSPIKRAARVHSQEG